MLEDSRIPSIIKEKTVPLACTGGAFWEGMLSVHRLRSDIAFTVCNLVGGFGLGLRS